MANPKTPVSSSSSSSNHLPSASSSKSSVVVLHQWWLVILEHQSKLAVAGFVNKETLESLRMRVVGSASSAPANRNLENKTQQFISAPILKKLNNSTLQAVDGTIIIITGSINRSRTLSHGFSHQVCDRFLTGFPSTWEDYATKLTHEKSTNATKQSFPVTFDHLLVTQVRDLIMSTTGESESCALTSIILRDIIKHSLNQNAASDDKLSTQPELDHKQDGVYLLNPTSNIIEQHNINSLSLDLHEKDLETSKTAQLMLEGGGFMSNVTHKISKKNRMKRTGSQTRYSLRSTRKRKTLEVSDLDD